MAIPVEHTIKLIEVNDPSKPYIFEVVCSCQWRGLAHTRLVAERWISSHAWNQNIRGNTVTIDRGTLGPYQPQAVAVEAPVEQTAQPSVADAPTGVSPVYPDPQIDAIMKAGKRN